MDNTPTCDKCSAKGWQVWTRLCCDNHHIDHLGPFANAILRRAYRIKVLKDAGYAVRFTVESVVERENHEYPDWTILSTPKENSQ